MDNTHTTEATSTEISNLGEIVGQILRAVECNFSDPISRECGIYGDPAFAARSICERHGVTLADVIAAVEARVSARCAYDLGLHQFDEDE